MRRALALLLLLVAWRTPEAAPVADLWPYFNRSEPGSTRTIRHDVWGRLLATYLRRDQAGAMLFAYPAVSAADRGALDSYIAGLAALPIRHFRREEQLPYWINLYNALTVRLVLQRWPVRDVRDIDISPGLFSVGPWAAKLVRIEGQEVSLADIEHRILRPIWRDPRIHYALCCAARGCPDLQPEPFMAQSIEKQLDAAALQFINSRRAVWIDNNLLYTSSLYEWYGSDFGHDDRAVIRHLMAYAEPDLAMRLQFYRRITGHDFDWTVNAAAR
jgi:Protein of unknown function, DUF547